MSHRTPRTLRALRRLPAAETPLTERSRPVPGVAARQLAGMWQGATAHAHAQACMHALHDAMLRVRSTPGGGGGEETTALSCGARAMIAALLQHPDAAVVEMALPAMSLAVRRWPEEALGLLPCILYRVREVGTQLANVPVASHALALSQLMLKLLRAMAELSVHPACVAPLMQALSPLAAARSPVLLQVRACPSLACIGVLSVRRPLCPLLAHRCLMVWRETDASATAAVSYVAAQPPLFFDAQGGAGGQGLHQRGGVGGDAFGARRVRAGRVHRRPGQGSRAGAPHSGDDAPLPWRPHPGLSIFGR